MDESAWGYAVATYAADGVPLSFYFAEPRLGSPDADDAAPAVPPEHQDPVRGVRIRSQVLVTADLDLPPVDSADAYLRLHLLSHRLVRPNTVNLDGIFKVLPNVGWTSLGPVAVSEIGAARVRLGAHLADGTTVMHEGFVNFNAGTLGPSMVEGRISQGVVVGAGADVGGGASIMGTLSGGGTQVISVGERCLLGANSGLGISLGDDCIVEAGLYLTAGTIVTLPDGQRAKARELSGRAGLLFRRNSVTGSVEAITRPGRWGSLSTDLHAGQ